MKCLSLFYFLLLTGSVRHQIIERKEINHANVCTETKANTTGEIHDLCEARSATSWP